MHGRGRGRAWLWEKWKLGFVLSFGLLRAPPLVCLVSGGISAREMAGKGDGLPTDDVEIGIRNQYGEVLVWWFGRRSGTACLWRKSSLAFTTPYCGTRVGVGTRKEEGFVVEKLEIKYVVVMSDISRTPSMAFLVTAGRERATEPGLVSPLIGYA